MAQEVVKLVYPNPQIALVIMQDTVNKNTFTNELISGLLEKFTEAENNEACKVIILTGYGNYFASGGTKEDLIRISEGEIDFTDSARDRNMYSLPLDCKLPVISAMQGHAIGGGFALGLFADFVILAREGVYQASFMKYGFTPGFGATAIFPLKLGIALAEEILITAKVFRGEELSQRGIPFAVYKKTEVLEQAMELAQCIAEKPRESLILLKEHLVANIREQLPRTIQKELEMHAKTFHNQEVIDRIKDLY